MVSRAGLQGQVKSYDLSPHDYLMILLDARRAILLSILAALSIGVSIAFFSSPVFTADSLVKIQEETNTIAALEKVNMLFGGESQADAEIEFVNSRRVLGKAVDNLQLDIVVKPRYFPLIGEFLARHFVPENDSIAEPLFGLNGYCWGGERVQVAELVVPESMVGTIMTLNVLPDNRFELLDDDDNQLLQGTAGQPSSNLIDGQEIRIYISELHARAGSEFDLGRISRLDAINSLKDRLSVTEVGHQSKILQLLLSGDEREETARTLNEIVIIYVEQNTRFRSVEAQRALEFLEGQLPGLRAKVEMAEKSLNDFRLAQGSIDLPMETQGILKSIVSVDAQLTELSQNRDELRQKFTPKHPSLLALDSQIYRLRQERKELEAKVKNLPETQQQILNLSRDVEVATKLYMGLLESVQELRIANASTIGTIQVIDHAVTPGEPTKPKKGLILMVSLIAGMLVSVIFVFVRQGLGRSVSNPRQLESGLHTSVVAEVPKSKVQIRSSDAGKQGKQSDGILALKASNDPSVIALRNLQSTLEGQFRSDEIKVIVITGPSSGVGTTFVSANLAVLMASAGDKVCLIDADFDERGLTQYFNTGDRPGLNDVINEVRAWNEIVLKTSSDGLHFISAGAGKQKPQAKMLKTKFLDVVRILADQYDRVIIDTSSINNHADAIVFGRLADITLLVAKAGLHSMAELDLAVRKLRQGGVDTLGIVLNSTRV